jgi:hypothetical protein
VSTSCYRNGAGAQPELSENSWNATTTNENTTENCSRTSTALHTPPEPKPPATQNSRLVTTARGPHMPAHDPAHDPHIILTEPAPGSLDFTNATWTEIDGHSSRHGFAILRNSLLEMHIRALPCGSHITAELVTCLPEELMKGSKPHAFSYFLGYDCILDKPYPGCF